MEPFLSRLLSHAGFGQLPRSPSGAKQRRSGSHERATWNRCLQIAERGVRPTQHHVMGNVRDDVDRRRHVRDRAGDLLLLANSQFRMAAWSESPRTALWNVEY